MMPWSKSEINEIRVELKGCLPGKAERLSRHLGRAKVSVKEKMREIELKEVVASLARRDLPKTTANKISQAVKNYSQKDKEEIYKLLKRSYRALCRVNGWEMLDLDELKG